MEKCQHSLKATFKRVKRQIEKGANPEKAARRGYDNTCEYFEIVNKRILILQRALAYLSISVAHILHRELYTMGNTGLLRREATPLFKSQLVKDGEDFLLEKAPLKRPIFSRGSCIPWATLACVDARPR